MWKRLFHSASLSFELPTVFRSKYGAKKHISRFTRFMQTIFIFRATLLLLLRAHVYVHIFSYFFLLSCAVRMPLLNHFYFEFIMNISTTTTTTLVKMTTSSCDFNGSTAHTHTEPTFRLSCEQEDTLAHFHASAHMSCVSECVCGAVRCVCIEPNAQ